MLPLSVPVGGAASASASPARAASSSASPHKQSKKHKKQKKQKKADKDKKARSEQAHKDVFDLEMQLHPHSSRAAAAADSAAAPAAPLTIVDDLPTLRACACGSPRSRWSLLIVFLLVILLSLVLALLSPASMQRVLSGFRTVDPHHARDLAAETAAVQRAAEIVAVREQHHLDGHRDGAADQAQARMRGGLRIGELHPGAPPPPPSPPPPSPLASTQPEGAVPGMDSPAAQQQQLPPPPQSPQPAAPPPSPPPAPEPPRATDPHVHPPVVVPLTGSAPASSSSTGAAPPSPVDQLVPTPASSADESKPVLSHSVTGAAADGAVSTAVTAQPAAQPAQPVPPPAPPVSPPTAVATDAVSAAAAAATGHAAQPAAPGFATGGGAIPQAAAPQPAATSPPPAAAVSPTAAAPAGAATPPGTADTTAASAAPPPPPVAAASDSPSFLETCSSAHVSAVTASLFHSCPVRTVKWDDLETVADVLRANGGFFQTRSVFNDKFPLQTFENLCLEGRKEERFATWVSMGVSSAASETPEEAANPPPLEGSAFFAEPPQARLRWKGYTYRWSYRNHAPSHWKYVRGTSSHHTFLSVQNFGHSLIDNTIPMAMGLAFPEATCTNLAPHPIENIVVDVGCADHSPDPDNRVTAAEAALPGHEFAPDAVCPLHSVGAVSSRWLLRLSVADPALYPPAPAWGFSPANTSPLPPTLEHDGLGKVKFLAFHESSASSPEKCASLPGVCFERFVVLGRNENRANDACEPDYNRAYMHLFRNATFRVFQLPEPFLVLPGLGKTVPHQDLLGVSAGQPLVPRPTLPRVLLYGREDGWRRQWLDVGRTRAALQALHDAGIITLRHTPKLAALSFCEQVVLFSQSDVIIMPQGAGILASIWSPEGAVVLEVFPSAKHAGGTWTTPMRTGLNLRVVAVAAEPVPHPGNPAYRASGQDDDFTVEPEIILAQIESLAGIDVTIARNFDKQEIAANAAPAQGQTQEQSSAAVPDATQSAPVVVQAQSPPAPAPEPVVATTAAVATVPDASAAALSNQPPAAVPAPTPTATPVLPPPAAVAVASDPQSAGAAPSQPQPPPVSLPSSVPPPTAAVVAAAPVPTGVLPPLQTHNGAPVDPALLAAHNAQQVAKSGVAGDAHSVAAIPLQAAENPFPPGASLIDPNSVFGTMTLGGKGGFVKRPPPAAATPAPAPP